MITKIFDYGMNGEGVGKIDGKICLVPNAIINEDVDIIIKSDNKNYSIGEINNILTMSKNRVDPTCPYFYSCGGCSLQHMAYLEQLKFKTLLVKKTLKKVANIDTEVSNCIASTKQYNYRNKMSFSFSNGKFGFFSSNSHNLVAVNSCPLADNEINKVLDLTQKYFLENPSNNDKIKNLVVRIVGKQILVGLVVTKEFELINYFNVLKINFSNIGLFEIVNTRKDSVVLSGKIKHIDGIKSIETKNFGISYTLDLLSFQQTNIDIQDKIYSKVLDHIDKNCTVVNGFSGQGLLSAIISTKAKFVYGIEIEKSSHKNAENLKLLNKITNLTNILGDFNKKISEIKNFDTLILDPSKKGCGKVVMDKIKDVKKIIYISCNPIALAKDLRELSETHKIETIIPFDMFPETSSVETLVVLKKNI